MDEATLQELARVFGAQMSQGDRSCVAAMLQREGAQQATTAGSAHCRFYEVLAATGWARQDTGSSLTAAVPSIRAWELTETGRTKLPALLPALANG